MKGIIVFIVFVLQCNFAKAQDTSKDVLALNHLVS